MKDSECYMRYIMLSMQWLSLWEMTLHICNVFLSFINWDPTWCIANVCKCSVGTDTAGTPISFLANIPQSEKCNSNTSEILPEKNKTKNKFVLTPDWDWSSWPERRHRINQCYGDLQGSLFCSLLCAKWTNWVETNNWDTQRKHRSLCQVTETFIQISTLFSFTLFSCLK